MSSFAETLGCERFHQLDENDAVAVISSNGVFKQAKLYIRGDRLFAGASGGFVQLYQDGRTSRPKLRWDGLEVLNRIIEPDALGRLRLK